MQWLSEKAQFRNFLFCMLEQKQAVICDDNTLTRSSSASSVQTEL